MRVLPFVLFVALTALQPYAGSSGLYWIYLAKTVAAGVLLWAFSAAVPEMRWNFSWEALLVGVAVFVLWIKLGALMQAARFGAFGEWRSTTEPAWNPLAHYGAGSALGIFFLGVRLAGSTLIVPLLEEVFFRSFLYRWIRNPDFQTVSIGQFFWVPFLVTSILFGFEHQEWLAGILCGFAYQGLVCWKKRLGDAITAHAITNGLLGCWVITKGEWHFW